MCMLVKVLRPRATVAAEAGAGGEPTQPHSLPMDAADANAIAEVRKNIYSIKYIRIR